MELLYKFAPETGVDYLLFGRTIRFSPAKGLNDVFEGLFDRRVDAERTLNNALGRFREENPSTANWGNEELLLSDHFCTNRLLFAAGMVSATREMLSEFGLTCFTTDPSHPLMWSHYADKGKGVAVGLDREVLLKGFAPYHYGFVSYDVRRPLLRDHAELQAMKLKTLMRKSAHWHYEREFRMIRELQTPGKYDDVSFEGSAIRQVIIGPFTPLDKIRKILLWHRVNPATQLGWALPNVQHDYLDLHKVTCSEQDLLQCAALRDEYI